MLDQFIPGTYGETVRYTLSVMHLQRKLQRNQPMLATIRKRLEHISFKFQHFTDDSSAVAASVAGLYQDTISSLSFRIQVTGSMRYLSDERVANQVRSLLFSGIRAAMLWRQVGGSRWKLLFHRRALKQAIAELRA
jgi:high frequency lysogenization protein